MISETLGSRCAIVGLPDSLSRLQALILQMLPGKLFTMDNYRSLQTPSTCSEGVPCCSTSLSHFIRGLPHGYSIRPDYDTFRQNLNR